MSTLEKKALAFEKLASLHNEDAIEEIIAHLDKLHGESKSSFLQHAEAIMQERNTVLQKLAQ